MSKTILILNGPNLNMLGTREPGIYGASSLSDIGKLCAEACEKAGFKGDFRQSNHEGELVTWVQQASQDANFKGVIVNAGAYTHTSVALHDALRLLSCPIVEVHLSNPMARESFRHTSYVAPLAFASICGLGPTGYLVAIEALAKKLSN
ncbi:MAG: type II 3-dehydroquinate dehydratase [Alphaproteobacteria bacterium]|nr:type II 3-dehydroquinate dehydratase [Alphaproteobacteria bacterium]